MFTQTSATVKVMAMTKRIRAIPGGTSASKTVSILLYLITLAQHDKAPTLTSVVSESFPHLRRGAFRDFEMIMKTHGYWKDNSFSKTEWQYVFETGSKIEFFSADQPDKLRGGRRDRLFINEANNVTLDAFEQLEVRTKEFAYLDWNPSRAFWYYTDVQTKRNDVEELTLTYLDNESLDPEIVKSIEARKSRKDWFRVYGLGLLGEVEGQIYKGWQIVKGIPHEARLEYYGLDFGFTNDPSVLMAVYKYNGGWIFDEVLYRKGMGNRAIADAILTQPQALVVADSAEPKSIDEIRQYGVNIVGAEKGQGSVLQGIQYLQDQRCSITERSVDSIRDYRNYMWQTDRDGKILNKPEHEFSHGPDAIRYGLSRNWRTIAEEAAKADNTAKAMAIWPNWRPDLGGFVQDMGESDGQGY